MVLQPSKFKYRKHQRGSWDGMATRGATLSFGEYGLQALGNGWITATQIEAGRVALTRYMKRHGKIWIRVFPDKTITSKPAETRMGKGKGAPEAWVAVVRRGRVIYEISGVTESDAREALSRAAAKFSIRMRFVARHR